MLHVATVHWHDERWIERQRFFCDRWLPEHRVYAALNGVDFERYAPSFHYAADLEGTHPVKLNALAERIRDEADDDDLLLFLDSDAFPIAPVDATLLDGYPLVAVRRDENLGSQQPHPCFCLTTVGFWFAIEGDWRRGYEWETTEGTLASDVGGNLLGILRERGIEWKPLLRSNTVDLDPLWFGVYGDVVYHHGAGSRPPVSMLGSAESLAAMRSVDERSVVPASVPLLGRAERAVRYRLARKHHERHVAEHARKSQELSDQVFEWVMHDDDFVRHFVER